MNVIHPDEGEKHFGLAAKSENTAEYEGKDVLEAIAFNPQKKIFDAQYTRGEGLFACYK